MQTNFTLDQLRDPGTAEAESVLRKCVHCGFCTATCPTYVTLGNELDSPRGRIYLIKDMLENERPADDRTVTHLDRCLSCLSCMTTCPSGVDYMHLVDHARAYSERTFKRPFLNRMYRNLLALVLPYPARFRASLKLAKLGRPFAPLFAIAGRTRPLAAMLRLAPSSVPADAPSARPGARKPQGARRGRVAILSGCAQPVLDPSINQATIDLLNRLGTEVVVPEGEGCCGALVHHMGREAQALDSARANIAAWMREIDGDGLDAIIITTSGCGTTVKDYGHMLRLDPQWAERAARVSALAKDVTEYLASLDLPTPVNATGLTVAYHSACSMQHGQKITSPPKDLLKKAGFAVKDPVEGHLCCGSAGTYNIMQPDISAALKARKVRHLKATKAEVIAAGNIGCITQIGADAGMPIVHTIKLLNWAWGGERPAGLPEGRARQSLDELMAG